MRKISAVLFIAATACGNDSTTKPPDATPPVDAAPDAAPDAFVRQPDFSCMGNTAPTDAPATINVAGTANDINVQTRMPVPVVDAKVDARRTGAPAVVDTTDTDAQGAWAVTFPNPSTMPVDGFIAASKAGHRSLRLYPPSPLVADLANAPLLMLSDTNFELLRQFAAGNKPQSPQNGTVGLLVVDCANMPVANATISVKQGAIEYADAAHTWDASMLLAGTFLIFDVPPGDTTVTATYNGMAFRAHDVGVVAATTTTTAVKPGF